MATQPEIVVPLSTDLRAANHDMDIIKGIEHINTQDMPLDSGVTVTVIKGSWMVTSGTGTLLNPGVTGVANTYPVWVGNDEYDSLATGNLTIIAGGGFIYETDNFVSGSYNAGDSLTVKSLSAGNRFPGAAGGGDAILARVWNYNSVTGLMQILVLNR